MTTTTPAPNPYIWDTTANIALCVAGSVAVYAASHRSLKKYVALKQNNGSDVDEKKDTTSSPSESEAEATATPVPERQSTRSKWANGLKITAFVVALASVGFGIGIGLPLLATPTVLDVVWVLFMTRQAFVLIRAAINTALPDPRVMEVHWTAWNSITWTVTGPNPSPPVPNTRARRIQAWLLSILCISGVYTGNTWLLSIPVFAFVYDQVSCLAIPDRKYKNMLKWFAYLQIGLATTVLSIIGIIKLHKTYFASESDGETSKQSKFSQPSPEVLALMTMYQKAMPLIAPGIFVALGLRFDYTHASKTMGNLVPPTGKPISSHDLDIPSFPRPMFNEGLKVFIIQLILSGLVYSSSLSADIKGALPMAEALCLPVWPVVARQVLVARRLGICQDLLEYSEPRAKKEAPKVEDAENKEKEAGIEDIEKAALADVKS